MALFYFLLFFFLLTMTCFGYKVSKSTKQELYMSLRFLKKIKDIYNKKISRSRNPLVRIFVPAILLSLLAFSALSLNGYFSKDVSSEGQKSVSFLMKDISDKKVSSISVSPTEILVKTKDKKEYSVYDEGYLVSMSLLFKRFDGQFDFDIELKNPNPRQAVSSIFPIFMIFAILFFISFVSNLSIGQFKAERFNKEDGDSLSFDDVIGQGEAKKALSDIVDYYKNPLQFQKLGASMQNGAIMISEPGLGKTLLAKALAAECNVNFISATGGDFSSKYFGAGINKVKSLFKIARKNKPCIIFIDEIDGIGRRTDAGNASDTEHNRIINQFLTEIGGFNDNDGIFILGATNNIASVDPALIREGRFDRKIFMTAPTSEDRKNAFDKFISDRELVIGSNIDTVKLGRLTIGFNLAKVEAIVNQAAILAGRESADFISQSHFEKAIDTIRIGDDNGLSNLLNDKTKERIAYHECGHAFVGNHLNIGKVDKVSIIPRGGALGVTVITPEEDEYLLSRNDLKNKIIMLLAGRCAEEVFLLDVSSGASDDLNKASSIAFNMTSYYGMQESNGSLFSLKAIDKEDHSSTKFFEDRIEASEAILKECYASCLSIIKENKDNIERIKNLLMSEETISIEQFKSCIK